MLEYTPDFDELLRFEKTLMARKARTGERSMVPPIGGMIPRNKFRYGSASVDTGPTIAEGA